MLLALWMQCDGPLLSVVWCGFLHCRSRSTSDNGKRWSLYSYLGYGFREFLFGVQFQAIAISSLHDVPDCCVVVLRTTVATPNGALANAVCVHWKRPTNGGRVRWLLHLRHCPMERGGARRGWAARVGRWRWGVAEPSSEPLGQTLTGVAGLLEQHLSIRLKASTCAPPASRARKGHAKGCTLQEPMHRDPARRRYPW
jgi:hypothetical protein